MLKEEFLHYLKAERNYSDLTIKGYRDSLNFFAAYVEKQGRKIDWFSIQSGDIREWIINLMDNGSAISTVNTRLSALRAFYRFLNVEGRMKYDPTAVITGPKKPQTLPKFVKESLMDRLFDNIECPEKFRDIRDRLIVLTFYSTGIRLAELIGLDVGDVDFFSHVMKVTGKRNKQRMIPFGNEMEKEMKHYLAYRTTEFPEAGEALFLNNKGKRVSRTMVTKIVKEKLGVVTTQKHLSPHILRHSFATAMMNNGAEIESIKELLGHKTLGTTQIYTHTTFEELKKAYGQAHPRGEKKEK